LFICSSICQRISYGKYIRTPQFTYYPLTAHVNMLAVKTAVIQHQIRTDIGSKVYFTDFAMYKIPFTNKLLVEPPINV
jgi:hypothetical protein